MKYTQHSLINLLVLALFTVGMLAAVLSVGRYSLRTSIRQTGRATAIEVTATLAKPSRTATDLIQNKLARKAASQITTVAECVESRTATSRAPEISPRNKAKDPGC